jgi:hypothetical protein
MKKPLFAVSAAVALMLGTTETSHASLILSLSDGTTTSTVSSTSGIAWFFGGIGAFAANVTTGVSKPLVGSAFQPVLDLNSIDVTAGSGGTLTIELTDTDFIGNGGLAQFLNTVGGTFSAGSGTFSTFLDCGNTPFGQSTLLTSQTVSGNPATGTASTYATTCNGQYSLTQVAVLTLPGNAIYSGDSDLIVTEPTTTILFGVGLIGLGLALRRKSAGAAA